MIKQQISSEKNIKTTKKKRGSGCRSPLMALGGRNPFLVLLSRSRDFEPLEHVPRSPVGVNTCTVLYTRTPYMPRSRKHEKRPAVEREKLYIPEKNGIFYLHIPLAAVSPTTLHCETAAALIRFVFSSSLKASVTMF